MLSILMNSSKFSDKILYFLCVKVFKMLVEIMYLTEKNKLEKNVVLQQKILLH